MKEAAADNGVDTSQFVRGMHAQPKTGEDESDSAGMWERGHASFLTLFTDEHGAPMIPYGGIYGGNQGRAGDVEWFSIFFHATIEFPDENGEIKPTDGHYHARIEGRQVEQIIRHVRTSRRTTIRVSGQVQGDKPSTTSIKLTKLED